ncbi:hypothetical protein HDU97_001645 [Phlyctochytrium planicorne]|nr:hypothetical protein HDU97_001645 [Phlyctochytrium planicorne]
MGESASSILPYSEKLFAKAVSSLEEDRLVAELFGQHMLASIQTKKLENVLSTNTHTSVTSTELQQKKGTNIIPALEDSAHIEKELGGSSNNEGNAAERHILSLPTTTNHNGSSSLTNVPPNSIAANQPPDEATASRPTEAENPPSDRGRQFPHTGRLPKSNIEPSALLASAHLTPIQIRPRKRGSTSNRYICPFPGCGQTFSRKAHLASHVVGHSSIKKYACEVCAFPFARFQDLKRHKETEHGIVVGRGRCAFGDRDNDDGRSNAYLQCPDCGARCKRQMSLRRHMHFICKKKEESPPQMEEAEQPYPTPISGPALTFEFSVMNSNPFAAIFQSSNGGDVEDQQVVKLKFEPSQHFPRTSSCSSEHTAISQSRPPPPFLDAQQSHIFQNQETGLGPRTEGAYASLPLITPQIIQMHAHASRVVLENSSGKQTNNV